MQCCSQLLVLNNNAEHAYSTISSLCITRSATIMLVGCSTQHDQVQRIRLLYSLPTSVHLLVRHSVGYNVRLFARLRYLQSRLSGTARKCVSLAASDASHFSQSHLNQHKPTELYVARCRSPKHQAKNAPKWGPDTTDSTLCSYQVSRRSLKSTGIIVVDIAHSETLQPRIGERHKFMFLDEATSCCQ